MCSKEIILSKIESIEKCLFRINSKLNSPDFDINNYDIQDVIVLNLQRACQQSIDLSMFICSQLGLGIPKDSVEAFKKLLDNNIISKNTFINMKGMVGFRNIAIHQYQNIDYDIVLYVINNKLKDFKEFNSEIIKFFQKTNFNI